MISQSFSLLGRPCLVGLGIALAGPALAQAPLPGSGSGGGGGGPGIVATGPGGGMESNTLLELTSRVFDTESDSIDLENGTFNWKGRLFTLGQNRAVRARFDRYLAMPEPEEDAQAYQALLDEIFAMLSVGQDGRLRDLDGAWQQLFQAADYTQLDGGNSLVVANQVFNAWRVRDERQALASNTRELENLRRYQESVVANRQRIIAALQAEQARLEAEGNGGSETVRSPAELEAEAAFRAKDLAETEARIKSLETQQAESSIEAKLQFQTLLVNLFLQRRFQHALLAAGFYRQIFRGSAQNLEVAEEEMQRFFPSSNLSFTVDTIEFLAREAINDVNLGMRAVDNAYAAGDRIGALKRLQETFVLGEHTPAVYLYPEEKRRTLAELQATMEEAEDLMEVRDLDAVEAVVDQIVTQTDDFPEKKVRSTLNSARSLSDFAVYAAIQYRDLGQVEQARSELTRAIDIWPSNPRIREFQRETSELTSRGTQGIRLFDNLLAGEKWRDIFERRNELGLAVMNDPDRAARLKTVVDRIAQVEVLLSQAEELVRQDNPFAAWEMLEQAADLSPDDGAVNKARANLAPRVARFAGLLDDARRLEQRDQLNGALARFLQVQAVYPASRLARQGIARLGEQILETIAAEATPADDEASPSQGANP
ncbi:MAG: hypothetical protein ACFE0O_14395 [Opitutales bacterium]